MSVTRLKQGRSALAGFSLTLAAFQVAVVVMAALHRPASRRERERGDVPGWVLVTLMTAGLVMTIWAVAGPELTKVFNQALQNVLTGSQQSHAAP